MFLGKSDQWLTNNNFGLTIASIYNSINGVNNFIRDAIEQTLKEFVCFSLVILLESKVKLCLDFNLKIPLT